MRGILATHDGADALWYHGTAEGEVHVERLSTGNMKRPLDEWRAAMELADDRKRGRTPIS